MRIITLLLFSLMLATVACQNDGASTVDSPPLGDDFDLATLPQTIDVHTAAALLDRDDVLLIDVREPNEYAAGRIPGITLIPMSEIESRVDEIPTDVTVVLSCQSGVRSSRAFDYLSDLGYENIHNLDGGFGAWQRAGYDVER